MTSTDRIRSAIRDVPDFPKPGIVFKDITPVLGDGALFRATTDLFVEQLAGLGVTRVAGIDARGFIFAGAVADRLGIGFIPIRKKGKLPFKTHRASYQLEYGESTLELHEDAVHPGEKIALIDDVLATGGTAAAAIKLLQDCQAQVVSVQFFIELGFLHGRKNLPPVPISSIVIY